MRGLIGGFFIAIDFDSKCEHDIHFTFQKAKIRYQELANQSELKDGNSVCFFGIECHAALDRNPVRGYYYCLETGVMHVPTDSFAHFPALYTFSCTTELLP